MLSIFFDKIVLFNLLQRKENNKMLLHSIVCCFIAAHIHTHVARTSEKNEQRDSVCTLHTHTYIRHTYTRMRAFTCISIPLTGVSSIACLGMNEPLRHALVLTGPLPQPSSTSSSSSFSSSSFSTSSSS